MGPRLIAAIPKRASGRNPYQLTPNEHDWLVMEMFGWSRQETALLLGVSSRSGHFASPLERAHAKQRAAAELQSILDASGPGPSSFSVARGETRMVGTR